MKNFKKFLLQFALVYITVSAFYYSVTIDIDNSLQLRRFIPAVIAFVLPICLSSDFKTMYKAHLLVAVSYIITAPLLNYLALGSSSTELSYPYDVAYGLYLFPTLVFLHFCIAKVLNVKLSAIVATLLNTVLLLPNLFQLLYYVRFKHCITSNGTLVIYQTNVSEAWEYISSGGLFEAVACAVLLLVLITFMYQANIALTKRLKALEITRKCGLVLAVVFVAVSYYTMFGLTHRIYFNDLCLDTHDYFKSIEQYKTGREKILKELVVESSDTMSPHTVVLVIGESAGRNSMSAFTDMEDDTTPWLRKGKESGSNFILLNNTYSCAWNTVPALEHALTEANFYNDISFNQSVSVIDIAKKAGYKTYWFSNQGTIGASDTPITLVADTADTKKWLCNETDVLETQYDEALLKYLDMVNPQENNFIVFHFQGSHIDYNNRYPKAFQKWNGEGQEPDYKNSLLYSDYVLEQIYNKAKDKLNLSAMVYFSDHGSDPNRRRNPDESGFMVLRVPMFIYLSDAYQHMNPEIYQNLKANQGQYISNDLVYDAVCGVLGVVSNHYDEANSIASDKYKYEFNTVKVGVGKMFAKDDPYNLIK